MEDGVSSLIQAWLSGKIGKKIYYAADFMGRNHLLFGASRIELYETMVVPTDWHEDYAKGLINAEEWLH